LLSGSLTEIRLVDADGKVHWDVADNHHNQKHPKFPFLKRKHYACGGDRGLRDNRDGMSPKCPSASGNTKSKNTNLLFAPTIAIVGGVRNFLRQISQGISMTSPILARAALAAAHFLRQV
jgi:hypothetical protein